MANLPTAPDRQSSSAWRACSSRGIGTSILTCDFLGQCDGRSLTS